MSAFVFVDMYVCTQHHTYAFVSACVCVCICMYISVLYVCVCLSVSLSLSAVYFFWQTYFLIYLFDWAHVSSVWAALKFVSMLYCGFVLPLTLPSFLWKDSHVIVFLLETSCALSTLYISTVLVMWLQPLSKT